MSNLNIKTLEPNQYERWNVFVQMCTHHNFTDWLPFMWKGFKQTTRYNYIINYENKTFDNLWRNFNQGNKGLKQVIAEMKKHGFIIKYFQGDTVIFIR
jgi:hypothetical protein